MGISSNLFLGFVIASSISLGIAVAPDAPGAELQLIDSSHDSYGKQNGLNRSLFRLTGPIPRLPTVRSMLKEPGSCSKTSPCDNGACCSKDGWCGYSPTHCGPGCLSNCGASAECGKFARPAGKRCPLNVCCSGWGFCGTTRAFCEVKGEDGCQGDCSPPKPNPQKSKSQKIMIGYYEGWNTDRKCNNMPISSIPIEKLTHLFFAFAYFSSDTFKITPMPGISIDKYAEAADLKRKNPMLKVVLALGGWSFNDPGPTQKTFSRMVSTKSNRLQFIQNLLGFLSQYGYDGVDFDWEYPGADDRGGSKDDGANYILLLQELRSAAQKSTPGLIITITIPTSYWYLRNFPISNLAEHLDWLNLMSYDIHGVWDKTSELGAFVRHHTDLDEIDESLKLLWRTNVNPAKVVLGLAFYGRSFKLLDAKCSSIGCGFTGPGDPGPCTETPGILSYQEIMDLRKRSNVKEVFDQKAGSKYLVYGNKNWVSYDDDASFQKKIQFANNRGLGGLMIWAIDLDNSRRDALNSVSLIDSSLGGDYHLKLGLRDNFFNTIRGTASCHITGCGEKCSFGFIAQTRLGHKDGQPNCPTNNFRYLCCPPWARIGYSQCQWNDGRGQGAILSDCAGTCNNGQVMLARDSWGWQGDIQKGRAPNRCGRGGTVYCCNSVSLEATLKLCEEVGCGEKCPKDTMYINSKLNRKGSQCGEFPRGHPIVSRREDYCCPTNKFKNCGWKDGGRCSESCGIGQIQLKSERNWKCYGDRERVLCCDTPKGTSEFLPFVVDDIFRPVYLRDKTLEPKYELKTFGRISYSTQDPAKLGIAFLVVIGDSYAVSTLRKRDNEPEPFTFIDCPHRVLDIPDEEHQIARVVCLHDDLEACFRVTERGVEGTLVEMPQNCGAGSWARAISLTESENQHLPIHMAGRNTSAVFDLKFDYNIALFRRDAGPTSLRMDYSNVPGYWKAAIYDRPKRSKAKRFYSEDDNEWANQFSSLSFQPGDGKDMSRDFGQLIYFQQRNSCPVPGDSQKYPEAIAAAVSGKIKAEVFYGYTMTATIDSEKLNIRNSNAFIRVRGSTDLTFEFNGVGKIDASKARKGNPWLKEFPKMPLDGHSVFKGFATFEPYIQTGISLATSSETRAKSGVDFNGKITVRVQSDFTDKTTAYPPKSGADMDWAIWESKRNPDRISVKGDNVLYAGSQGSGTIGLNFFTRMGLKVELKLPKNLSPSKPLPDISREKHNLLIIQLTADSHKERRCLSYMVGTAEKIRTVDPLDEKSKNTKDYTNAWQIPDAGRCFTFSPFQRRSPNGNELSSQLGGIPGWKFTDPGHISLLTLVLNEYIKSQKGNNMLVPSHGGGSGSGSGSGNDDNDGSGNGDDNDDDNDEDDDGDDRFPRLRSRLSLMCGLERDGETEKDICCGCICMICVFGDGEPEFRPQAPARRSISSATVISSGRKTVIFGALSRSTGLFPQFPAFRRYGLQGNAEAFLPGNEAILRWFHNASADCRDWSIVQANEPDQVYYTPGHTAQAAYETEHILEAQTLSRFFQEYISTGALARNGDAVFLASQEGHISFTFSEDEFVDEEPPDGASGIEIEANRRSRVWVTDNIGQTTDFFHRTTGDKMAFAELILDQVGSRSRPQRLALLSKRSNSMKARIFGCVMPVALKRWISGPYNTPEVQLMLIKEFGLVFHYLNHPVIWEQFCNTYEGIYQVLRQFDDRSRTGPKRIPGGSTDLQAMWRRYMRQHLDRAVYKARRAFYRFYYNRAIGNPDFENIWADLAEHAVRGIELPGTCNHLDPTALEPENGIPQAHQTSPNPGNNVFGGGSGSRTKD